MRSLSVISPLLINCYIAGIVIVPSVDQMQHLKKGGFPELRTLLCIGGEDKRAQYVSALTVTSFPFAATSLLALAHFCLFPLVT